MKQLRPHQVFDRIDKTDRLSKICLPHRHSLTSMLERAILTSLLKIVKPRIAFEFGTYFGETTMVIAANTGAKVYSIDLDESHVEERDSKLDGFEVTNVQRRISENAVFQGTKYESQIETITGDSRAYDFSHFYQRINFVLIDGGHHIDVVRSDTRQALKMLAPDHPACILWHDYGNPHYKITDYLNDLSGEFDLYHVDETNYVFFMKNIGIR